MINQKFDYLYAENGRLKAVVVDNNGEPQVTDVTPDKPYSQSLITDGKGDTLVVSKKGQVMGVKEYQFAGDNRHLLNEYHRQLDSLGEWIIQFDAFDKQDYGFDKVSNKKGIYSGSEYYPYLSANYDLRYKSVETGKTDKVVVDFGSYPEKDSVIFKDKYGVNLKLLKNNILSFIGTNQADTNYIYAYRGDQKIGKLMLNVYKKKPIKVCLVMVNGAHHKESFSEIKKYLDKIYKPAVVQFEVVSAEFEMPELTSFSHGGSPWNSVYNDDQKRVLRAYNDSIKDGIYYLFFIDNVTDKKDGNGTMVSGYMPRGYNCGFIYDGGSPHTIAHELGHGIAGLEHVFENSSNSGKTKNLMDYSEGEELWHFQWDQIQDPSRVWMKWNKDEEEGENVEKLDTLICFKIKGNKTKEYEYTNGGLFATMHTNDKVTIEIISKDTTLNVRKLSWFFDKNNLSSTDSLNNKVELTLDEKTISLKGNSLSVKDSLNKVIASLKFQAYLPPYVEFSIKENERGEFLWDDSFRRINKNNIYNPTRFFADYDHNLTVGKDNHKYYAPVLGLQQNQTADILLNFKEFDKLAQQDKNCKIVIKSDNPSIRINNDPSIEINSSNIDKYKSKGVIKVKFTKILQEEKDDTTGVLLYAEIPSLNKKIGLIECFCKPVIEKAVTLIYVRFGKKDSYPLFSSQKFESYLNDSSFNQLFRHFSLSVKYLDAFIDESDTCFKQLDKNTQKNLKLKYNKTMTELSNLSDLDICYHLDKLKEQHNTFFIELVKEVKRKRDNISDKSLSEYKELNNKFNSLSKLYSKFMTLPLPENSDYYYITDISKGMVGGFHNVGGIGGVRLRLNDKSKYNETEEELNAHELGHWLGLPHVYEGNKVKGLHVIQFTKAKTDSGQSIDNFMDYNLKRKSWFKNQLINVK